LAWSTKRTRKSILESHKHVNFLDQPGMEAFMGFENLSVAILQLKIL